MKMTLRNYIYLLRFLDDLIREPGVEGRYWRRIYRRKYAKSREDLVNHPDMKAMG